MDTLRDMSDVLRDNLAKKNEAGKALVVLATVWQDKPAFVANVALPLVNKGYNAVDIVRQVAAVTGGSGGGKATLAQGGGKDKNKIKEALDLVDSLIRPQ